MKPVSVARSMRYVLTAGPLAGASHVSVTSVALEGNAPKLETELAKLELAKRNIGNRGLSVQDMIAELSQIESRTEEINSELATAEIGHWADVPTGETYAAKWTASDDAGKREMLKDLRVTFGFQANGELITIVRRSDEDWFQIHES